MADNSLVIDNYIKERFQGLVIPCPENFDSFVDELIQKGLKESPNETVHNRNYLKPALAVALLALVISLIVFTTREPYSVSPTKQTATFVMDDEPLISTGESDFNELAMNFSELVSKSDMIIKIKVESVRSFINEYGFMITEVTPTVTETYKGHYDGQNLYVESGEMPYEEYSQNEVIKKITAGHEAPPEEKESLRGTTVKCSLAGEYIMHPGEEYIFFAGKRADSGENYPQYAYQGIFKIKDGKVENHALNKEPLREDLGNIFNADTSVMQERDKQIEIRYKLVIDEDCFTKKIKELCN